MRKRVKVDGKPGKEIPSKLRRVALNWEPSYPEGEDEVSMKGHKEALGAEWKRRNPDKGKIETGMMLTFPERIRLINKQTEISELRAQYPSLFDHSQVHCKFALYN